MVKDVNKPDNSFSSSRGGSQRGGGFGGRGGRGGYAGGNRGGQGRGFPQGPPAFVVSFCTFVHPCENQIVLKATDMSRVPKFNRGVYLESKAKVGSVDEILGPIDSYYFSAKLEEGVKASSFKAGQVLYMNPEDLLPMERFIPKPKVPGQKGAGAGAGGRGGFRGAPRGGFRGGPPRGGGFQRGGPRGGGFQRGGRGGRGRGGSY